MKLPKKHLHNDPRESRILRTILKCRRRSFSHFIKRESHCGNNVQICLAISVVDQIKCHLCPQNRSFFSRWRKQHHLKLHQHRSTDSGRSRQDGRWQEEEVRLEAAEISKSFGLSLFTFQLGLPKGLLSAIRQGQTQKISNGN